MTTSWPDPPQLDVDDTYHMVERDDGTYLYDEDNCECGYEQLDYGYEEDEWGWDQAQECSNADDGSGDGEVQAALDVSPAIRGNTTVPQFSKNQVGHQMVSATENQGVVTNPDVVLPSMPGLEESDFEPSPEELQILKQIEDIIYGENEPAWMAGLSDSEGTGDAADWDAARDRDPAEGRQHPRKAVVAQGLEKKKRTNAGTASAKKFFSKQQENKPRDRQGLKTATPTVSSSRRRDERTNCDPIAGSAGINNTQSKRQAAPRSTKQVDERTNCDPIARRTSGAKKVDYQPEVAKPKKRPGEGSSQSRKDVTTVRGTDFGCLDSREERVT